MPARFVSLAKLPLTPSGKVDRKALCERQLAQQAGQQGRGPRREYGDIAQQVLSIWREVLESDEPIGPDDGFFEVGGPRCRRLSSPSASEAHSSASSP